MGREMSEKQKRYLALAEEGRRYWVRIPEVQPPEVVTLLKEETDQTLNVLELFAQGQSPTLSMDSSGFTRLDKAELTVQLLKSALPESEGEDPKALLDAVTNIHQQRYAEFIRNNQTCVDSGIKKNPYQVFGIPQGFMKKQAGLAKLNPQQKKMCETWDDYEISWRCQETSRKALEQLQSPQ